MAQPDSQQTIFADAGNRAAALLLDLILASYLASSASGIGFSGIHVFFAIGFVYFAGMPLSPLQGTLGKWICRIKLCDRLGGRLSWRASALRAASMLCWFGLGAFFIRNDLDSDVYGVAKTIFWLSLFLPFAPASFLPRGESLFDLLAGSLVVRYKADADAIALAPPGHKRSVLHVSAVILLGLLGGFVLNTAFVAHHDMDRYARIRYAIAQTQSLREEVEAFHAREQRWPSEEALELAQWTPYPDGGEYRLQADGSILISFAVLPDLKGHSLNFRPTIVPESKKIRWECTPDAGFPRRFLPSSCR